MNAQAISLNQALRSNLRPFDIRRDLVPVADLVELCFADNLDADGRLYIRQMRQAARSGPLLDLASAGGSQIDLPMGGYVWQEGDRVVGNLSLIPHRRSGERLYLIANVAVHPDYRKRGVARALTQAALEDIERRGRKETWLQVDENNPTAVGLYRSMGFRERLRRTSWRLQPRRQPTMESDARVTLRHRRPSDWPAQKIWLRNNYPAVVRWQLPLDFRLLQPGLKGGLQRLLSERQVLQWGVEGKDGLLGILSWQSSSLEADRLWLAAQPGIEDQAIPVLAGHAHAVLRPGRTLALNYPARRAEQAFTRSGFQAVRTLIWMDYPWPQ
ncbi:MAG TPA: N-acetyltransferase [Anaerolineales bacterium]|nr:N-acetyltransferase [Anaerolineales bacterium]